MLEELDLSNRPNLFESGDAWHKIPNLISMQR